MYVIWKKKFLKLMKNIREMSILEAFSVNRRYNTWLFVIKIFSFQNIQIFWGEKFSQDL